MNQWFEEELEERFSFMKKGPSLAQQHAAGSVSDLYSAFGCACRDGWFELIFRLCLDIQSAYEDAGKPVDIIVDQVKEKYGSLRFYYHFKGEKRGIKAFDFMIPGGVGTLKARNRDSDLHEKIKALVDKAEKKSLRTCELCGAPGRLRDDYPHIETLCDKCAAQRDLNVRY